MQNMTSNIGLIYQLCKITVLKDKILTEQKNVEVCGEFSCDVGDPQSEADGFPTCGVDHAQDCGSILISSTGREMGVWNYGQVETMEKEQPGKSG